MKASNFLIVLPLLFSDLARANHYASEQTKSPKEFVRLFDNTTSKGMPITTCEDGSGNSLTGLFVGSGHVMGMSIILKKSNDVLGRFELYNQKGVENICTGLVTGESKLSEVGCKIVGEGNDSIMELTISGVMTEYKCRMITPELLF